MADLSLFDRAVVKLYKGINKITPWHKLPTPLGVFNLLALRYELRAKNLYDVYPPDSHSQGTPASDPLPQDSEFLKARNSDGKFNDLQAPRMGCAGMRFGRNVPRSCTAAPTEEELMTPNPRVVSERLLKREEGKFKPATIVNLLAAAWIQFQVHDWAFHLSSEKEVEVPLPPGDTWPSGHMKLPRTQRDEALDDTDKKCPAYRNANTAWWDSSQLYGSSEAITKELRGKAVNGKLMMTEQGNEAFLPRDDQGLPLTGFNTNWWLGLELLHTLFALEHNAICDMLLVKNPDWSSDQLFDTARLVNCALMAKIHTVEWTPAILDHPTLKVAMNTNWWGLIGEKLTKLIGNFTKNEVIGGIPGSGVNLDNVPYSLTEEFVAVYRLHSLIPDNIAFFSSQTGTHATTLPISSVAFSQARDPLTSTAVPLSFSDAFFSFGINYPGAITHHNIASFMRQLPAPDGVTRDMGTVDILRDRERAVPRYNAFRRLFHMPPAATYLALTGGDAALAQELSDVYGADGIEKVDLLVGCLCEPLPKGFGFSDTAFRVFILMASRRLTSDRFISGGGWKKEVYTKEGMAWVQNETMASVLKRHFPELGAKGGALDGVDNAFRPWKKIGAAGQYKGPETNASV